MKIKVDESTRGGEWKLLRKKVLKKWNEITNSESTRIYEWNYN